jgi:glutathione peroxidase
MAPESFYQLQATLNNEQVLDFSALKGKKVLIVNTATKCGHTPQLQTLEALYLKYKESGLLILHPIAAIHHSIKGCRRCMKNLKTA